MSDDFKGRGQSPWGSPPGGGGNGSGRGPTPPDIDAIIRDIQNKINWENNNNSLIEKIEMFNDNEKLSLIHI